MIRTNASSAAYSGVNISFWFAVFSPVLGILLGFLGLLLLYR